MGLFLVAVALYAFISLRQSGERTVLDGFHVMREQENVTAAELIKYLDKYLTAVSKQNAAAMVQGLEEIQQARLPQWQKRYEDEALQRDLARVFQDNGWKLEDFSSVPEGDLKALLEATVANGYKVETAEGFFFPVIDYGLYRKYRNALPPDMIAYIEIMGVESDGTPVKDAALMIDWEEILQRARRQERFIKEYPASARAETMRQLLRRYVTFALFGANNTPLFNYQNKQMQPEAKKAYLQSTWNDTDGKFSEIIGSYLKVLEKNAYRLTPEVDNYRKAAATSF